MKVLWVCNMVLPQFAQKLNIGTSNSGGWMVQTLDCLIDSGVEVCVCAPVKSDKTFIRVEYKNSTFLGYNKKNWQPHVYDKSVESFFMIAIKEFKPDVLHIFGSEFPHAFAAAKVFNKPNRTVLHIQGLISFNGEKYQSYIPNKYFNCYTFRDFIRHDNIRCQKEKFIKRGKYEIELIQYIHNVMGRTDWDRAASFNINPFINYYKCQENLREIFYGDSKWDITKCIPHSIFMSQGSYPIKGFHLALEILKDVVKKFPDTILYIAGDDFTKATNFKDKIRKSSYSKYIAALIKKYRLERNIVYLGTLNASEMYERYLMSNVYLSSSVLENSPNSIMEAMIIGVPVVASDVGGVSSLIDHKKEGFLYPCDETYIAAYYIEEIFQNNEVSTLFSRNEISRMRKNNSVSDNIKCLIDIYNDIIKK